MPPLVFRIDGLDCAEEADVLRRELAPLAGGEERLAFDLLRGRVTVDAPAGVSARDVVKAVARTGMRAQVWVQGARPEERRFFRRRAQTLLATGSGAATLAAVTVHAIDAGSLLQALDLVRAEASPGLPALTRVLYALALLSGGLIVAPRAWLSLKSLRPDMNLLMALAVFGALTIGEWFEAATVTFLFALSLDLEAWSLGRARKAVEALTHLAPATARIRKDDGAEAVVAPEEVSAGSVLLVKPGERIPLDGTVLSGESDVNQAPITGESLPVAKSPGRMVFAGTINGGGALVVRCTRRFEETTLHHLIRMVEDAQLKRAPLEQWVDRFARVYTPTVLAAAALVLIVPPVVFGADWTTWLYRSLVLLVIGCPCALVISTPVSIVAGLARAAHNGILVKGGRSLEAAAHLKALAFDKTGTLTEGKPSVVQVVPLNGHDETELLERAGAMEARSDHPLAKAIVAYAEERGLGLGSAESFQIIPGKGATGVFGGRDYWLGSHRYLEERGQETAEVHEKLEVLARAGHAVVVVGNDSHVCGFIAAADRVRSEAREALSELKEAGVEELVMLTGDNAGTAEAIAVQAGIDRTRSDLLPQDKVAAVEELVERYGFVGMVGDGVNDAPAMARATLGIAMGAAGSDAAIETADVALMSDDLLKLPWLVRHARRTVGVIRQNVTLALSIKAIFVGLTLAGHASLWAAIAADMGASLLVIFNGLRLLQGDRGA